MARTAVETANTLSDLYDETFANESFEMYRIAWSDLRALSGVRKLTTDYLGAVTNALNETGVYLIPFNNFLAVLREEDMMHIRSVPPRLTEQALPDAEDESDVKTAGDEEEE